MPTRDIIVIGGSAGAVEAMMVIARELPASLAASVFVTVHFPANSESVLPRLLDRAGALPARHAVDGEPIRRGTIYVAPPDRHLLIYRDHVRTVRGPTDNGNRPSIDPMFRSAAQAHGARVIGVVLTGNLDDGTAGLFAIKRRGGLSLIQDPADAHFPSMPASARDNVAVDYVVPVAEIGPLLVTLCAENMPTAEVRPAPRDAADRETAYSALDLDTIEDAAHHPGHVSPYGCPDCGGVLWEIRDEDAVRYRCRVGHGWTSPALLSSQRASVDTALWSALRALEERASLSTQMAERALRRGRTQSVELFRQKAARARERAAVIREVVMQVDPSGADDDLTHDAAEATEHETANLLHHTLDTGRN